MMTIIMVMFMLIYSFNTIEIMSDPIPDPKPFTTTICKGSFKDNIRVQLFSNPQQTQASKINVAGHIL